MNIPTLSQNSDPSLRKLDRFIEWLLLTLILCVTLLVCCSCSSTKVVTQTVRDVSVDTVYLSNVQYDSIYIYQERTSDYHMNPLNPLKPSETDTVFIKDVSVEYRYKLLKDTIRVVERDSIPYQVTITETKEIQRPLTWYDHLTRSVFWIVIGILFVQLVRFVYNLKKRFTL